MKGDDEDRRKTRLEQPCPVCGTFCDKERRDSLSHLRKVLAAVDIDRCKVVLNSLNVASILLSEIDRLAAEVVALRAQLPSRVHFTIDDRLEVPVLVTSIDQRRP
jgi:hypothetical protein